MANSLKFHSTNSVLFGSIFDKSGNEIPIITDILESGGIWGQNFLFFRRNELHIIKQFRCLGI